MELKRTIAFILPLIVGLMPTLNHAASQPAISDESTDALVLAIHLMRPEVIDTCLKEIRESKYDFVWTAVTSEEARDPVNVTFKLKATLIDKAKQSPTDQVATLTVARDVEKLRKGMLYFICQISYEAKN